jgi:hypothetical protein
LARTIAVVVGPVVAVAGPQAPLAAFAAGSEVGVPTGTSLTATSGIPTQDATVSFSRTDPITGGGVSLSGVKQFSARSWASTVSTTVPSGEVWWFDRCRFAPSGGNFFAFDVDTSNGANSRLSPTLIFTRCDFGPGSAGTCDKALTANRAWVEDCVVGALSSGQSTCEDGWTSCVYCTVIGSNVWAGVGANVTDPHSDGVQLTDTGSTAFYRCWLDGGPMVGALQGNAGIRCGTEFGALDDVWCWYCGIGGKSGNNVQFRGDNGGASTPITGVNFKGNRWCSDGASFLHDFQQEAGGPAMIEAWVDNKIGVNCTIGGTPYTAGDVISSPGV